MSCLNWSMAQNAPGNWILHRLWFFGLWHCVVLQVNTDILKEHAASISSVEDCQAISYHTIPYSCRQEFKHCKRFTCIGCNLAMIMPRASLGGIHLSINSFQSVNFTTVCFQASVSFSNSTFLLAVLHSFTIQNEKLHPFTFTLTLHYVCVQASHMGLWHKTQSWVTDSGSQLSVSFVSKVTEGIMGNMIINAGTTFHSI